MSARPWRGSDCRPAHSLPERQVASSQRQENMCRVGAKSLGYICSVKETCTVHVQGLDKIFGGLRFLL